MELAKRVAHMTGGGDDGWQIYYRARDMIAQGQQVLNLTIGEHDTRTDPAILAEMNRSALAGNTGYSVGSGSPALRAAIANRVEKRTGVPTGPENIFVTPGGQAALFAAHMLVLDAGDTALFCDPYYATYPGTIRATGGQAVAVPARSEDGFQPDAKALAAVAPGARSLLINSPNNPTGVIYSRATLQAIAAICRDHDLWLISDEVYDTQIWEGDHISPRSLPDMAERTLVVGSLSKSHAMTGSRIGWLVGPAHVIKAMWALSNNTTYGIPAFIQDAGLFALGQGPAAEEAVAAPFRRRREIALKLLAGSNALTIIPSAGGMYLMLDLRATGFGGNAFAEGLLQTEGIAVMPGESFGAAAAGHIRIAMTIKDDRFEEAMMRLRAFAESLI
ncbi:MAG: pyridoxal phosphate-dependent aminotransferase [Albidovulum sp.]